MQEMGEIGRPVGKKINIPVERSIKNWKAACATSHSSGTQLQARRQKAQGGEGTPTKDRIKHAKYRMISIKEQS